MKVTTELDDTRPTDALDRMKATHMGLLRGGLTTLDIRLVCDWVEHVEEDLSDAAALSVIAEGRAKKAEFRLVLADPQQYAYRVEELTAELATEKGFSLVLAERAEAFEKRLEIALSEEKTAESGAKKVKLDRLTKILCELNLLENLNTILDAIVGPADTAPGLLFALRVIQTEVNRIRRELEKLGMPKKA